MSTEIKISADGTGFITNLISEYGIYFLLILILGVIIYKFSGKFLDLISGISSPLVKDAVIVVGIFFVGWIIYVLIGYAIENFKPMLKKDSNPPTITSPFLPNLPLPIPTHPTAKLTANVYGHVKVLANKPQNDEFIDGIKLEIRGIDGSKIHELSGKNGNKGFYSFNSVPVSDGQKTIAIFPELNGFILSDGLSFIEAAINDETTIVLKKVNP